VWKLSFKLISFKESGGCDNFDHETNKWETQGRWHWRWEQLGKTTCMLIMHPIPSERRLAKVVFIVHTTQRDAKARNLWANSAIHPRNHYKANSIPWNRTTTYRRGCDFHQDVDLRPCHESWVMMILCVFNSQHHWTTSIRPFANWARCTVPSLPVVMITTDRVIESRGDRLKAEGPNLTSFFQRKL
jgi:hypothetical protein